MTTHDELRNAIAEVIAGAICEADEDPEVDSGSTDVLAELIADAVLERLAAGAYRRAVKINGTMATAYSAALTRRVIAATLGLDPTEVPT